MGVSSRNTGMMLKLKSLVQSLGDSQDIFLVMSSTTKGADLIKTALEYQKIGYSRLIFTRLDETDTCGSILNVVCRMGVPVAFVSHGQSVPDDITAVNPRKLAGLLLEGVDRYVEQGYRARA
jgi:flagellar biosynthesis protein FlhF